MPIIDRRKDGIGRIDRKGSPELSWFKNVAKSLGYSTEQLISNLVPSMADFTTTNVDYAKELSADLRELKTGGSRLKNVFSGASQMGHLRTAMKNALEDAKSGNFYNKARTDALNDFDMDTDFSMDDFELDSNTEPRVTSSGREVIVPDVKVNVQNIQPPISRNSPMVKVMQKQTEAIYETTRLSLEHTTKLNQNSMMMDHKNSGRILEGLQVMNDNISMLVNFQGDSMTKYIGASLKYYEESLNSMNAAVDELKKGRMGEQKEEYRRVEDPTDDVLLSGGGLNAKGYVNMVKANLKRQFSENAMLSQLKHMFDDDDTIKMLAASPLSFLSTKIVSTIIPQFLQNSMGALDKSFSNFFPALFMRLNRETTMSNNPILQTLGDIFGLNIKPKTTVDLGKYQKGTVPFDGITKKSIVEVIPGYLRKILAAISGQQEQAYDFNKGTFNSVANMRDDYTSRRDNIMLSEYGDSLDVLRKMTETFQIQNTADRESFMKGIEKFMINLTHQGGLINPTKTTDRDGLPVDELRDVFDFGGDTTMQKMFRQMVLSMGKSDQMRLFGKEAISAKTRLRQFMTANEENPLENNINILMNALGVDEHLENIKGSNGSTLLRAKKGGTALNPVDSLGFNSLDYLRDIKKILLKGIRVFAESIPSDGSGGGPSDVLRAHSESLSGMNSGEESYRKSQSDHVAPRYRAFSPAHVDRMKSRGQQVLKDIGDFSGKTESEIAAMIQTRNDYNNSTEGGPQDKGVLKFISKFLKGDTQTKFEDIRLKVQELFTKPAELLKVVTNKIDGAMYSMVFGGNKNQGGSFMEATMAKVRETFDKFTKWTAEKIIDPLQEKLFGKNGIFTKMKDSDLMKSLTGKIKSIGDFVFGKPDGLNGKREGGMLSDTANSFADMWDSTKYFFTGKPYTNRAGESFVNNTKGSVFGEVQGMVSGFKNVMKTYLFGDKDEKGVVKEKGVLGGAIESLKDGFRNWSEALFGRRSLNNKDAEALSQSAITKLKERAPKAIASGIVGAGAGLVFGGGILGTLIGGPVTGAIIGTSLGYLTQSEKFKRMVFGEKDMDGNRMGGIISKGAQDFFKKNRIPILGGMGIGAIKSITGIGLLPSFLLPGGPITGAMLGIAASLAYRSETFQKFLFGEKDADGKRMGGIIKKSFGTDGKFKKVVGNVGVGILGGGAIGMALSGMGIMGAIAGGPITGAILGAAAGIALSSDKWKSALFGDIDPDTDKRKGGLLGKFNNWFKLEVMAPLRLEFKTIGLNIKEWFGEKISNPFREAIEPIKHEFKLMTKRITDIFTGSWKFLTVHIGETFEKHVATPFGNFMRKDVMEPLKGFMSKLVRGIGNIFGSILESPVKLLSMVGQNLTKKHMRQGVTSYRQGEREDMFGADANRRRADNGETLGWFGHADKDGNSIGPGKISRMFNMYRKNEATDAAAIGPNGASYLYRTPEEKAAEDAKRALEKDKIKIERAKIDEEKKRLKVMQALGLKVDYDNFDKNGNDVSRIYSSLAGAKANVKASGSKLKDLTDEKFQELSGLSLSSIFGKDVTIDSMSKEDRDSMMSILNGKLQGEKLKKFITGKFGIVNKLESSTDAIPMGPGATADADAVVNASDGIKDSIDNDLIPVIKDGNKTLERIASLLSSARSRMFPKIGGGSDSAEGEEEGPENPLKGRNLFKGVRHLIGRIRKPDPDLPSHASGLDAVPYDDYEARLHRGEMVIPANQANSIREGMGMPRVEPSSVRGPRNKSNRLVNKLGGGAREPLIIDGLSGKILGVGKIDNIVQDDVIGVLRDIGHSSKTTAELLSLQNTSTLAIRGAVEQVAENTDDNAQKNKKGSAGVIADKVLGFFGKQLKGLFVQAPMIIGSAIKDATVDIGKAIFARVGSEVKRFFKTASEAIKDATQHVWENYIKFPFQFITTKAKEWIAGPLAALGGWIRKKFAKVLDPIIEGLTWLGGQIKDKFNKWIGEPIKNALSSIGSTIMKMMAGDGTGDPWSVRLAKFFAGGIRDWGSAIAAGIRGPLAAGDTAEEVAEETKDVSIEIRDSIKALSDSGFRNALTDTVAPKIDETNQLLRTLVGSTPTSDVPGLPFGPQQSPIGAASDYLPSVPGMADSIHDAIASVDSSNDRDAAERARVAAEDANFDSVSYKTADYQIAKMAASDEKEFTRNSTEKQTSLLGGILDSTKEHNDNWLSIFGKKGLLTVTALAALPFLGKIWDWLKGFFDKGNDGQGNQSGDHSMTNALKYGANRILKFIPAKVAVQGAKMATNAVVAGAKSFANSKVGQGVGEIGSKAVKAVTESAPGQLAIKAIDVVKDEGARVLTSIKAFFEKLMKHEKVAKVLGSGVGTAIKLIMENIGKFAKNPTFVSKMLAGIATGTAKVAGSVSTAGLLDAGFAIWNVTTGFINKGDAAYLFNVYEDSVTPKMRAIAALMKTILGVSYLFILELLNAVLVQITNGKFNVLLMIANSMYKAMSDDEAYEDLSKAQLKFEEDAKENGMSKSAWNEKNNKTFERKMMDGMGTAWEYTKTGAVKVANAFAPVALARGTLDAFDTDKVRQRLGLGEGTDVSFGQRLSVGVGSTASHLSFGLLDADKTSKAIATISQAALDGLKSLGSGIAGVFNSIVESIKKLGPKITEKWEEIGKGWNATMDSLRDAVVSKTKTITTSIGKKWDEIMKPANEFLDKIKEMMVNLKGLTLSDGWEYLKSLTPWGTKPKPAGGPTIDLFGGLKSYMKTVTEANEKAAPATSPTIIIPQYNSGTVTGATFGQPSAQVIPIPTLTASQMPTPTTTSSNTSSAPWGKLPLKPSAMTEPTNWNATFGVRPYETSTTGLYDGFTVTSNYGPRQDPFSKTPAFHSGIDIVKYNNAPITAFAPGTVVFAGMGTSGSGYGGYGNAVGIKDQFGYTHVYGHLNSVGVSVGQNVGYGTVIGTQGSTGQSTGSHLHYEVRQAGVGTSVNPSTYLTSTNGGQRPPSSDGNTVSFGLDGAPLNSNFEAPESASSFDVFGKMLENFGLLSSNLFNGQNKQFNIYGKTPVSPGVVGSTFTPVNVKEFTPDIQRSILDKATQTLIAGEGGRADLVVKDKSSSTGNPAGMSIGMMQWNRERGGSLIKDLVARRPGVGFEEFLDANLWNSSAHWSDDKIARLQYLLKSNIGVAESVQREKMANDIMEKNLSPIFNNGKLKDPRSIVMLSDIGNTGPAYISSFLSAYTPPSPGTPEFPHFFNELKNKSLWGKNPIYTGRLDNAYKSLQSWIPAGVSASGLGGPTIPLSDFKSMAPPLFDSGYAGVRVNSPRVPRLVGSSYIDSYRSLQASSYGNAGTLANGDTISKVIAILQDISNNTGDTAKNTEDIASKKNTITVISKNDTTNTVVENDVTADSDGNTNIVLVNGGNKTYNANPIGQAIGNQQDVRDRNAYRNAKAIASGR